MRRRPLIKYKIDRNAACPCGSGIKYKKCCLPTLGSDLKDKGFTLYNEEKYEDALTANRAYLTQYIIWHNEHTVPFVSDRPEDAEPLLKIDIDAMASVIDLTAKCIEKTNKEDTIDDFLKYAFTLISDWRYQFYISILRAWWFFISYKPQSALDICQSLEPINTDLLPYTDICNTFLRMLYDVTCSDKSFTDNLELLNIILSSPEDSMREAEDLIKKATLLWIYSDTKHAYELIETALIKLNSIETSNVPGRKTLLLTQARANELTGYINDDVESFKKAQNIYNELITMSTDNYFISMLLHSVGLMYLVLGDLEGSLDAFCKSYEMGGNQSLNVKLDLAHNYTIIGEVDNANKILDEIPVDEISGILKIDYLNIRAQIAITENNMVRTKEIQEELEDLDITAPLFREIRDKAIINLLEIISSRKDQKKILANWRKAIAKYFILQPNVFGIGINFNKVLDSRINDKKNNDI